MSGPILWANVHWNIQWLDDMEWVRCLPSWVSCEFGWRVERMRAMRKQPFDIRLAISGVHGYSTANASLVFHRFGSEREMVWHSSFSSNARKFLTIFPLSVSLEESLSCMPVRFLRSSRPLWLHFFCTNRFGRWKFIRARWQDWLTGTLSFTIQRPTMNLNYIARKKQYIRCECGRPLSPEWRLTINR